MKIYNIRLGHATNSSSSHSMIFAPNYSGGDDFNEDGFGWDFFTVASSEGKKEYVAAMIQSNLRNDFSQTFVDVIMKGLNLPLTKAYVDHQSVFNFPKEFNNRNLNVDFLNDFKNYLLQDGILILGGNDNTEEDHSLSTTGKEITFNGWGPEQSNMICRKEGDWWVLFSPVSGNRIVMSFYDNPEPFKPKTPLLMDVKISEYCDFGCAFCYTNSTRDGQHISKDMVYTYAFNIAAAEVFEVAIGGGEPMQCPHTVDFITYLTRLGVKANFTTKDTSWLEDEQKTDKILNKVGALALSVEKVTGLDRVLDIFKYRKYDLEKLTLQVIPAAISEYDLEAILLWAYNNHIRVTLLGFKETGRGGKFKEIASARNWNKFDETAWITLLQKFNNNKKLGRISIDTTLASRYEKQLKAIGLPEWLYHVEEGKYSMYLDMVRHKYGPSSYHLDKLQDTKDKWMAIEDMFSNIEPV